MKSYLLKQLGALENFLDSSLLILIVWFKLLSIYFITPFSFSSIPKQSCLSMKILILTIF